MNSITPSEIAGFGVGALLLCATVAAPKVDAFISASQRSSLGMCKRCGDLRMIACSECRGAGFVRKGGMFRFRLVDDLLQFLGDGRTTSESMACVKCRSQGRTQCPDCSLRQ